MRVLVIVLIVLVLASCRKELEKPRKFIEKDKMTEVLYDFALLSGIENVGAFYADTASSIFGVKSILKKHQIDSLTFAENNRYYIELGDETYFQIQEDIKKRLEVKKVALAEIEKVKQEEKKRLEEEEKAKKVKLKVASDTLRSEVVSRPKPD